MRDTDSIPAVVISTDSEFRRQCREIFADPDIPLDLGTEFDRPFAEIGDRELEELRHVEPGLILVDLESDPQVGLLFIQFLVESGQAGAMVAAGRELSQDLLLQAMRAGVTEVLAKPLEAEQVREALQRVLRKTGRGAPKEGRRAEPGRAIVLCGAKGGMGTTTLATNLAIAIHRLTRQSTLLLDLDIELGETSFLLGMEPKFSLIDLLRNFHRLDSGLLASFITHHDSGIEVIPAPAQPVDFDTVNGDRLRQVLRLLREQYEWVVIDRPTGFHSAFHCVLEDADETYLVTTPDLSALRNVTRSLPLFRKLRGRRGAESLRLVVNRSHANQAVNTREIEEAVGLDVFFSLRDDAGPVADSINEGSPVVLRGSSNYANDVRKLAGAVSGLEAGDAARKGLLGGLRDTLALPKRRTRTA